MAGTHAHKSPSGAERLHECPGSLALIAALPPEQKKASGQAAQMGTVAHALLEWCLEKNEAPSTYKGRLVALVGDKEEVVLMRKGAKRPKKKPTDRVIYEVDDTMVRGVTVAWDYITGVTAGLPKDQVHLETKTNPLPDRDDTQGTADITVDDWPTLLWVMDYKNGRMTVEHRRNPQLLSYLLGRAHQIGWDFDRFRVTIIQPWGQHEEGPIRHDEVTAEELREFEEKHRAACERADLAMEEFEEPLNTEDWGGDYLKAGDHCTFCDAMAICPAYRQWVGEQAMLDFNAEPISLETKPSITDPARVANVLKWKPYMQALIKAAERYASAAAASGQTIPGHKLVRGKSVRVWKPDLTPAQIEKAIKDEGWLNENEVAQLWKEPELITGTQAEKLLPTKVRRAFNDKLLHKPEGRLVLVDEDDPRPSVTMSAEDEFEPLEE